MIAPLAFYIAHPSTSVKLTQPRRVVASGRQIIYLGVYVSAFCLLVESAKNKSKNFTIVASFLVKMALDLSKHPLMGVPFHIPLLKTGKQDEAKPVVSHNFAKELGKTNLCKCGSILHFQVGWSNEELRCSHRPFVLADRDFQKGHSSIATQKP